MLFAGFTAAKKTIIQNWFTPHMCRKTYWIRSLLQIVTCECTTARVGGAKPSTIDAWQCFLFDVRDCMEEWLVLCFYCPSLSPSLLTWLWAIEYMSVVLFCYILDVMLCYVWKKKVDNKKNNNNNNLNLKISYLGSKTSRCIKVIKPGEKIFLISWSHYNINNAKI